MTIEPENAVSDPQTVPAQEKQPYRPWVGVVLSLFISGAAQFLAGQRVVGLTWFLGIFLLQILGAFWLASQCLPGIVPGFVIGAVALVLWIIMLARSYRPVQRLSAKTWLVFMILVVILPVAQRKMARVFVQTFVVPTGGMSPTIQGKSKQEGGTESHGDRLWVEKYAYWFSKPRRGDVVVFSTRGLSSPLPEDQYYVKRIVGIPGDVLTIRDDRLHNHGEPVSEPAALADMIITNPARVNPALLADSDPTRPNDGKAGVAVPPGHYFVMGDNTGNSFDSRFWGTVPEHNIIGRVSKLYWPLNRAGRIR